MNVASDPQSEPHALSCDLDVDCACLASAPVPLPQPYYQDEQVTLYHGDCSALLPAVRGVHLTVTSPPYADLIDYGDADGQLGSLPFGEWRVAMREVMADIHAATTEAGRAAINLGDVCIARKAAGRHYVLPLVADLTLAGYETGFDYLTPIRWEKVANAKMEASSSSGVLGKPNQPGGVIKNDTETILLFRKPGAYRQPTEEQIKAAHIPTAEYVELFRGVWRDVPGISDIHPAAFPLRIPARLIRMFSFPGDVILDPFAGTGTTLRAAKDLGRKAIGMEVEERFREMAARRLSQDALDLGSVA